MISLGRGVMTMLAVSLFAFPHATPSWAVTGGEIVGMCKDFPDGPTARSCELYVRSMIEFVNSGDKLVSPKGRLCVGENVPISEVVSKINAWLAAHPELHEAKGYDATFGALAQEYKCK